MTCFLEPYRLAVVLPYEATFLSEVRSGKRGWKSNRLVGCIRAQLREQISQACADSDSVLHEVRPVPTIEARLSKLDYDALGEDVTRTPFCNCARGRDWKGWNKHLASSGTRRRLRDLIHHEFSDVPVLCEAEISAYVRREKGG